ncbi:hypothetical protein AXF42_Ash000711 [Apostasia shenzhenica]|uniref:Uncharacterized protein n=1 Tax=Apostasia shenzhenica TaxID=1088818 RepID=A0A2I0AHA4_9ASPA|nr:hypothetical protein AXF42_Ash000711 [Apostasia shenzhenica]
MQPQLPSQSPRHHPCICFPLSTLNPNQQPHHHRHFHVLLHPHLPLLPLPPCRHHHPGFHHLHHLSAPIHLPQVSSNGYASFPPQVSLPPPAGDSADSVGPVILDASETWIPTKDEENFEMMDAEEEEGEEDIFVLTDEWREFFAKSEAKRKLGKQQSRSSRN